MSDVASIIIGAVVALITLLMACGAVIGFVWRMYNKIEDKHTASSKAQHIRLDNIFKQMARLDKQIAILYAKLELDIPPHATSDD